VYAAISKYLLAKIAGFFIKILQDYMKTPNFVASSVRGCVMSTLIIAQRCSHLFKHVIIRRPGSNPATYELTNIITPDL
jgi:hypothetical protein